MSAPRIAVVGVALRYPDADTPDDLWRNVLAGRRAFRRIPDERLRADDYYSPDPKAPDRHYARNAAVLEGFEFDRVKYRIGGSTFRSTDMTHWLALDTAARALADAGFPSGEGLPRAATGVVIGNSLTGEFSRANLMRLRWPYVRRTVAAALRDQGWDEAGLGRFLDALEERYKSPFPAIDEDTLAGGLANTISGRICNYFDLGGGGFTVDGACSSSLLSVSTACNALAAGQLDVAVAGGVDLSIDPFELIGFAKTGALASGEMRVYDTGSNGFWPGEGCGMLVLMRDEEAVETGKFRYATIAGWGYSSDGKGGITRPEAAGHRLAMQRAYRTAGFGIDTVSYIEGHGTGTAVGDATELRAFTEERRATNPDAPAACISTVKGNFGHTKAAAGVAGLIKAVLAVRHQVIPPATGHVNPHAELTGDQPALRVPAAAELWPEGAPIRAAVSSMGFGGINAHIVVEHADGVRRTALGRVTRRLVRSRQDAELLLVDAVGIAELRGRVARLATMCNRLSYAELGDLAATLAGELDNRPIRAAVVARSPQEAEQRFGRLLGMLDNSALRAVDVTGGVFLGSAATAPRIGFLFPGQGAGRRADGGALRRRFELVDELYRDLDLPTDGDQVATAVAQPRIVAASVAALRVLRALDITATGAAGHSLGELTALHWAGAMDEAGALRTAAARGRIMAEASDGNGAMAGLAGPPDEIRPLLKDEPVVIAGYNGPRQTVVSGPADAVERVCELATARGTGSVRIRVSHAFHSDAVAPAADLLRAHLAGEPFAPLERTMTSTVTAGPLPPDTDVADLLTRQVLDPVRFAEAVESMAAGTDLFLEVGPGQVLGALAAEIAPAVPAVSMDSDSPSLAGLLHCVGAAYALGAPVDYRFLFQDRFTRPLSVDKEFSFLASPCETAAESGYAPIAMALTGTPTVATVATIATIATIATGPERAAEPADGAAPVDPTADPLEVLRRLAAERSELPLDAVRADSNPLDELHLSSITVGQIVNEASRELGITAPLTSSNFATSTLAQIAEMLGELGRTSRSTDEPARAVVQGAGPWIRAFAVDRVPAAPAAAAAKSAGGDWRLFGPAGHPLAEPLLAALRRAGLGGGVLLCLPRDTDETQIPHMLAAARAALSSTYPVRFVAVGDRRGAAGLAKTLHLEAPNVTTTVVSLPLPDGLDRELAMTLTARITADVAGTTGFSEVRYDAAGTRTVPVLRPLAPAEADPADLGLDPQDVLLVTGGGKGITAECALALGRRTGARIALLGRSPASADDELAANLDRMTAAGVVFEYVQADVTSPDQVKEAVDRIRRTLGPVTAVLHGAGRNEPHALAGLDESSFRRTLAPKIGGLETVLAAVDPGSLKLLVTFGSIIGRAGLRGEADYATANDWLTDLTDRIGEQYPGCRCLALEWSVWSGAGMGERLGVLESLLREGITPIPVERGVQILEQLLADPNTPGSVVVMGRAEGLDTIALEQRELPLQRFIDRPRVYYPGVELVVDADLTADSDPYLADHLLDGSLLFPAVIGMEAMAQAAAAVTGHTGPPTVQDIEFLRPIVVPVSGSTTVRIAVLAEGPDTVLAAIRSSETSFQADHFRATLRYAGPISEPDPAEPAQTAGLAVPVDPAAELYGPVLFQGGRFRRLAGYRRLAAKSCVAQISNVSGEAWFGGFLPPDLVLADPGTRDAMMHSIQCCVPDATLLPVGVERLRLADPGRVGALDTVVLEAAERWRDGDTYMYDLDIRDESGGLLEQWQGLRLQAVRKQDGSGPWVPALLGPYLERRVEPILGDALRVVLVPDGDPAETGRTARRRRTAEGLSLALGRPVTVRYRGDGRPEVAGAHVSASHGAGVTLAVTGQVPVGCDVERAVDRTEAQWEGLLGPDGLALAQLVGGERGESLTVAATRVWSALECLQKVGHAPARLVHVADPAADRWVRFRSGGARVATFATNLIGTAETVILAMLAEGGEQQ